MTEICLILGILLMILILAFVFIKKKDRKEPNYNVFIALGTIYLIIGIANSQSNSFLFVGLLFLIIGLYKKSKDKDKQSKKK